MSARTKITVETTIHCDGGWHSPLYVTTSTPRKSDIAASIRAALARNGWVKRGTKHLCGEHQ